MKKYCTIFSLLVLFSIQIEAQNFSVWNLKSTEIKKNITGFDFTYNSTLFMGVGYARVFNANKTTSRRIALQAEISSPLYLIGTRNVDLSLSGSTFLINKPFDIKATIGTHYRFYEDVLSKGGASFFSIGINPGYFASRFHVASEISWKSNISTSLDFNKELYPNINDTIIYNSTRYLNLGICAGVYLKNRIELNLRGIYQISAVTFKNYPPYTQNLGVSINVNYSL
jgi:hypothetical protein